MEKCERCKKRFTTKHKHDNVVFLYSEEFYFCDKHYREVCKVLRQANATFPKEIKFAKPTTKEWTTKCRLEEKAIDKYLKSPQPSGGRGQS